jgi:hypothetical protein
MHEDERRQGSEVEAVDGDVTFHQPDEADRQRAEATGAGEAGLPDLGPEADELRATRPSSAHDPNAPDRPKT